MHPSIRNRYFTYEEHGDLKAYIGLVTNDDDAHSIFFGFAINKEILKELWDKRGYKVIVVVSLEAMMNKSLKDMDTIDLRKEINSIPRSVDN